MVSSGPDHDGAYTRDGVISEPCSSANSYEQENCDNDGIFSSVEKEEEFNDRIAFSSSIEPAEWQISEVALKDIHLKKASNNIAIGVSGITQDNLDEAGLATVEVRKNLSNTGGSIAAADSVDSSYLCLYETKSKDGTSTLENCIPSTLIGGNLKLDESSGLYKTEKTGHGISCPGKNDSSNAIYMVGIQEDGEPICTDEIFVACTSGKFVGAINDEGQLVCVTGAEPCGDAPVNPYCGGTKTPETVGDLGVTYSGICYDFVDSDKYDTDYFATNLAGLTWEEIQAFIVDIAWNSPREERTCDTRNDSLVRDTYECGVDEEDPVWNSTPTVSHEIGQYGESYPVDLLYGASVNVDALAEQETGYPASSSNYMDIDPNGWDGNHDCWCREDFRAAQFGCWLRQGYETHIQRHPCPQTGQLWEDVYVDDSTCICEPGTETWEESCISRYWYATGDYSASGLVGNVTAMSDFTCDGNQVVQGAPEDIMYDTSECECPGKDDDTIIPTLCPKGTTNSWVYDGKTLTGIASIDVTGWVCPGGTVSDPQWTEPMPKPGSIQQTHVDGPACVCDSSYAEVEVVACSEGLEGGGKTYLKQWDCTTGEFEPQSEWELIDEDCHTCALRQPPGSPNVVSYPGSVLVGSSCTCGSSDVSLCYQNGPGSNYSIYDSCECLAQSE